MLLVIVNEYQLKKLTGDIVEKSKSESAPKVELRSTIHAGRSLTFRKQFFESVDISPDGDSFIGIVFKGATKKEGPGVLRPKIYSISAGGQGRFLKNDFFHNSYYRTEACLYSPESLYKYPKHIAWVFYNSYLEKSCVLIDDALRFRSGKRKAKRIILPEHHLKGLQGWSPNGKLFAVETQSKSKENNHVLVVYDIKKGTEEVEFPMDVGSNKLSWSPTSQYVCIPATGQGDGAGLRFIDLYKNECFYLSDNTYGGGLTTWHPDGNILASIGSDGVYIWDINKRIQLKKFNDILEKHTEVSRKYRQRIAKVFSRDHSGCTEYFECNPASNISFSPDGSVFVSSDDWGNIVIRDTVDFGVKYIHNIDSHSPSSAKIELNWLACDKAGLIIQVNSDNSKTVQHTYYIDATCDQPPQEITGIEEGKQFWSKTDSMIVMQEEKVFIYKYE